MTFLEFENLVLDISNSLIILNLVIILTK
jgi:hypothetical protein